MEKHETLGTIWEVPDELWEQIEPSLWNWTRLNPEVANVPTPE